MIITLFEFFKMFIFGLALICSWIGIGWIFSTLIGQKKLDSSILMGFGLSVIIILGGILNLAELISKKTILLISGIGLLAFIIFIFKKRSEKSLSVFVFEQFKQTNKFAKFLWVLLAVIIIIKYAAVISYPRYNVHDDLQGYFVFPTKMIQTGTMGNDPFSERRLASSLGGQSFLDTLILTVGEERNLSLLDRGVAYLAFLMMIVGLIFSLPSTKKYLILFLFAAALLPAPILNITASYTGIVLFLLVIRLFYEGDSSRGIIITIGLVLASVTALKNSLAVGSGLFCLAYVISRYESKQLMRALKLFMAITVSVIAFLAPWLISSYKSGKTLFYPVLGKGYHGSVYGDFLTPTSDFGMTNIQYMLSAFRNELCWILLGLVILYFAMPTFRKLTEKRDLIIFAWVTLSSILIAIATAGCHTYRYTFPILLPAIIALLARYASAAEQEPNLSQTITLPVDIIIKQSEISDTTIPVSKIAVKHILFVWVFLAILIFPGMKNLDKTKYILFRDINFGLTGSDIITEEERHVYSNLQSSIPENEAFLARLNKNFSLNFNRNTIFIADSPGGQSLPPGLPFRKGSEPVSEYFISKGIRYIAYSYQDEAQFPRNPKLLERLTPETNAWVRSQAEHTFDFNDNLKELGETRKRIYDDGTHYVIDLALKKD